MKSKHAHQQEIATCTNGPALYSAIDRYSTNHSHHTVTVTHSHPTHRLFVQNIVYRNWYTFFPFYFSRFISTRFLIISHRFSSFLIAWYHESTWEALVSRSQSSIVRHKPRLHSNLWLFRPRRSWNSHYSFWCFCFCFFASCFFSSFRFYLRYCFWLG